MIIIRPASSHSSTATFFVGSHNAAASAAASTNGLEEMANVIVVGLAVLTAAKTEDRLRRQQEERKRGEERLRREQAARLRHIEDRRIAGLATLLEELDELYRLRRRMTLLSADVTTSETPRIAAFVAWSRQHLTHREASLSGPELERRLAAERLFGQGDDHGFNPNRWY